MNRFLALILVTFSLSNFGQENMRRPIYLSTQLDLSFYHLGSYSKERATIYLEQAVDYQFDNGIQVGGSFGFNAYPGLLAIPLGGQVRFPVLKKRRSDWFITQSLHKNLPVGNLFYGGNRYRGELSSILYQNDKLQIIPALGYSFIWDRYGGIALSFNAGLRVTY